MGFSSESSPSCAWLKSKPSRSAAEALWQAEKLSLLDPASAGVLLGLIFGHENAGGIFLLNSG
jgi:hypothetical protein